MFACKINDSKLAWYSRSVNSNEKNSDALIAAIDDIQIFGKRKLTKRLRPRKVIQKRYKAIDNKKYS
jgi:hypothetical protein